MGIFFLAMHWSDLSRLNTGLTRIVSTRQYPVVRKQYVQGKRHGRIFRIGVLHGKEMSEKVLQRNQRGFINAQLNTVAHAPSMYHWLYHRCGIPFSETRELVKMGGLRVDDVLVTSLGDLESQLQWSTFQQLDIQVRSFLPMLSNNKPGSRTKDDAVGDNKSADAAAEGEADEDAVESGTWVPALKRALHRTYSIMYVHPGISVSSDESDPRSFTHRIKPSMGKEACAGAALGLNVLRPIGFINGMRGLAIVSNDVAVPRYWNNEFLGNYGVYDIRFPKGVPSEVVHNAAADLSKTLSAQVWPPLNLHPQGVVRVPCSCTVEDVRDTMTRTATTTQAVGSGVRDVVATAVLRDTALHPLRILVSTPLMPYRLVQRIRRAGGMCTLVRSGPFALPAALVRQNSRPLSAAELAVFFTFERGLKINRLLLGLTEFGPDDEDSEE